MSNDSDRDAIENALRRDAAAWRDGAPPAGLTCVDAETLAAWADGALPAVQAAEVEAHLADCARCQAMAATFAMTDPAAAATSSSAPVALPLGKPWVQQHWLPLAGGLVAATLVIVTMTQNDVELARINPSAGRVAEPGGGGAVAGGTVPMIVSADSPARPRDERIGPAPAPKARTGNPGPNIIPSAPKSTLSTEGGTAAQRGVTFPTPAPVFVAPPAAAPPPPPRPAPIFAPPAPAQAPPPPPPALQPPTQLPVTTLPGVPVIPSPKPLTLQPEQSRLQDMRAESTRAISVDSLVPVVEFASPSVGGGGVGRGGAGGRGGGGAARLNVSSASSVTRWRFTKVSSKLERSTDDGLSWETIDLSRTPIVIAAGAAPSRMTCWLVGRGGVVLRSTDSVTFARVAFPETVDLVAITVTDALTVTVTAVGGRQFTTADGGATWREIRTNGGPGL